MLDMALILNEQLGYVLLRELSGIKSESKQRLTVIYQIDTNLISVQAWNCNATS